MRFIKASVIAIVICCCSSNNRLLTEEEFAKVYLDSLIKRHPAVTFDLQSDLTIISKKDSLEYKHYVTNAYIAYKQEPDSLKTIINWYMESNAELYQEQLPIDINKIIPVIKPIDYLTEVKSLSGDTGTASLVYEPYNDQLIIVYAEDRENSIQFLTEEEFKTLALNKDSLRSVALRNFDRITASIERNGENGVYIVFAGGESEASLILLKNIWTEKNFPVEGDFVIAIPNRDLLLITGSKNKEGINKLRSMAKDSYTNGNYSISEHLYIWTGDQFKKFDK